MVVVLDSPVRLCTSWLKKPLGTQSKTPVSLRRRLDTYGYAPESILYDKEETILCAMAQTGSNFDSFWSGCNKVKSLEWLNPMVKTTKDIINCIMPGTHSAEICGAIDGTIFSSLTKVQGGTTAVESETSLSFYEKLVGSVYDSIETTYKARTAGGNFSRCKDSANDDFCAPGKVVKFEHNGIQVNGDHATRITNNELHVVASRFPRMRAPAGSTNVVFKSLNGSLACLLIPEGAWTNCDGEGSGKFRAEKLYVVAIWDVRHEKPLDADFSNFDRTFRYQAGTVESVAVNKNPAVVCGAGLHFFLTLDGANNYYHQANGNTLKNAQKYFEQMLEGLPELPKYLSSPEHRVGQKIVAAAGSNGDVDDTPPETYDGAAALDLGDGDVVGVALNCGDTSTYSSDVEPTPYLASRPDRETEVRNAQLLSFRARLRYSAKMFRSHCEAVRAMLDPQEKEDADIMSKRIDEIPTDRVEDMDTAAEVFAEVDRFRVETTRKYIDPNATHKHSSLYFSY